MYNATHFFHPQTQEIWTALLQFWYLRIEHDCFTTLLKLPANKLHSAGPAEGDSKRLGTECRIHNANVMLTSQSKN